jgi:hypothetical protein
MNDSVSYKSVLELKRQAPFVLRQYERILEF